MKAKLFNLLLTAALLVSGMQLSAQDEPKFKKEKSYSKSYNVSSSDRISLENQFGEMKLVTWDRNEVKVDVTIIGMSDEESRAQAILDRISIVDEKNGNGVSFKTKFANDEQKEKDRNDKDKDKNNKSRHEGMKINYTVHLPTSNPLNAKNQFGPMVVPDYRGEANLESQFGSLTTGKLSNSKNIRVQFGKADLGEMSGGKLDIGYTSATVSNPSGDIDANFQFSTIKINIDNDIKSLDIKNSYSDVYLDLSKNLSASYKIDNSFGSFTNKSNFTFTKAEEKNKWDNNSSYSGKSGNGDVKITVNSSFGSVVAGHDLKVDMDKKEKEKNKNKDKDKDND